MKKKKIKVISLLLSFLIIVSLITFKKINVDATDVAREPKFTISELAAAPNPAKVGEDIVVTGKIIPQDFETTVQPKEIVLVLDTSGSMATICTENYWIWGYGYCNTHKQWGEHYSNTDKIDELKKAAKSFIETMKDVPNLKIGIVSYATDAKIVSELTNANDSSLITVINNLSAFGGTNIREGLRKAAYLLREESSNTSKTVVLMTDGKPTFYSKYDVLDESDPEREGDGRSTTIDNINYTKALAKEKIGDKQYNAYSIGYGLDGAGKGYLKQIHAAMKGLPSYNDSNKDNGFFEKSDGSITEIFNQIAENIKNSYELQEVSLDIGLNEASFRFNIEGREIQIDNIIYNKITSDEEVKATGRAVYHADPVNFSFIVNGIEEGENQLIFDRINIKFSFDNEEKNESFDASLKVNLESNDLPNITAKLISGDNLVINKNDEITLKYEINPEDFVFNNASNSGEKDIVVLFEKGITGNNTFTNIKNALVNRLVNELQKEAKTRFSFITFDNQGSNVEISLSDYLDDGTQNSYYEKVRHYLSKDISNGKTANSSSKNIYDGLEKAVNELSRNSRATANKNIIIIANNTINYYKQNSDDKAIDDIRRLGYNVVTLSLGNEDKNSRLYTLHGLLGGEDNSIFNTKNDPNNIDTDSCMGAVREKIVAYAIPKPYEFNPVINLNIGSNFEPVSGINRSSEGGKSNIGIVEIEPIVYNLGSNNTYHAESKIVTITLRANNLNSGTYKFGDNSDNTMKYKGILGETINKYLNTPVVTVRPQVRDLTHGLYNGIENNNIKIDTSMAQSGFSIAANSTITYGASFILSGKEVDFTLNLDSKFTPISSSEIKAYVVDGARLIDEGVSISNTSEANVFRVSINDSKASSAERQVLLIYKRRMVETAGENNDTFTNEIRVDNLSKPVTVRLYNPDNSKPKLPDLF
ncbi:vWA domain-containing protein [Clostridium isatidis]|uniref:vWA domain-containing protein n=1 Tax=Clostridium isatidis TaxID=182773 RepID=UPI003AAD8F21